MGNTTIECSTKSPYLPLEMTLGTGLKISTGLLKELTPEFLEVDSRNSFSGERIRHFLTLCTTIPILGGVLAVGAASYLKSPEIGCFGGPVLIFGGPVYSLALYLQDLRETEKLKNLIDASILGRLSNQAIEEEVNFKPSDLDKLRTTWNPVTRVSSRALVERLRIYKGLPGTDKPGLTALLISPFVLFEKNGMVGEEKIVSVGVEKLMPFTEETGENTGLSFLATAALSLLYKKREIKKTVQRAVITTPGLTPDQKKMIMAGPDEFREQLKSSSCRDRVELRNWYDGIFSYLEQTSSLAR